MLADGAMSHDERSRAAMSNSLGRLNGAAGEPLTKDAMPPEVSTRATSVLPTMPLQIGLVFQDSCDFVLPVEPWRQIRFD
jgi:hypothetical protein